MKILGIDIGTTTVTALVLDTEEKRILNTCTRNNDSFIKGKDFERIQDPQTIINTVKAAVKEVTAEFSVDAVGVTGQMHGILYLDSKMKHCSPLFIWQDERGNLPFRDNKTYAEHLTELTGIKASTGFGLTTHFYNLQNGLVPENAVMLCTIHDYIVSILTEERPVTHSSDAASLGFFDMKSLEFSAEMLSLAEINKDFLPRIIKNTAVAGKTACDFLPQGIPVGVAIGDNQASFLGSVAQPESSVLVNVGTGSQVSFVTECIKTPTVGEIRPLTDGKYIYVGSSLCGGRAYAILKNFFSLCADMLGGEKDNLYTKMDSLSENIFSLSDELTVNCEFCGSRENPTKRGSIENIGTENFTPEKLICGVLKGVSDELKTMYLQANDYLAFTPRQLVCSGNGLRKSKIWRDIFSRDFSLPASLPGFSEEAAVGACVFAAAAIGLYKSINNAQNELLR
ncbi:MAG: hypothetical protein IIX14_00865 [Clostridia bacterium]|nr:hypothetical protein [Clostridia bacterium]